jgi:hypothetical protein
MALTLRGRRFLSVDTTEYTAILSPAINFATLFDVEKGAPLTELVQCGDGYILKVKGIEAGV